MRCSPFTLAIGMLLYAAPATAHHVVSTSGVAWVEPLHVVEANVHAASFDFGELRGDWQVLSVRGELAPTPWMSISARVPWAHLHLSDGRRAIGLSDVEAATKFRLAATEHGGFIASAGLGTALPTGATEYGLGAGHWELAPFVAIAAQPHRHIVLDALATQTLSLTSSRPTDSADGPHGALVAPHSDLETATRIGAAWVGARWYARVGAEGVWAWRTDEDGVSAEADLGYAMPARWRIAIGGALPIAGTERFRWLSRVSAALQF